jgi:hypothetical protein
MKELPAMAHENSISRLKPGKNIFKGETIVKSISPVKGGPDKKVCSGQFAAGSAVYDK